MTPRTTLQGRKQDFVRREIWNAAVDLFARTGYDVTTVEEIAAAAGVSRRTFFRYFASKDDLMVKAIDTYGDQLTAAIRNADSGAPLLDVVRQAVVTVVEDVVAQPRIRDSMTISMTSTAARRAQLGELEIVTDRIAAEYARIVGRRPLNAQTARLMASLTIAILTETFRTWYERESSDIRRVVDDLLASMVGLLPAAQPAPVRRQTRANPRPLSPARRSRRDAAGQ